MSSNTVSSLSVEVKKRASSPHNLGDLDTLPHRQVKHDLARSTPAGSSRSVKQTKIEESRSRNGVRLHISVETLDLLSLSSSRVAQPAKDLTRLASAELECLRRLSLQQGDRPSSSHRERVGVVAGRLIDDRFDPRMSRLYLHRHVGELGADHWVLPKFDAEGGSLRRVLDGLFEEATSEAVGLDGDAESLRVEVGHDESESLVLLWKASSSSAITSRERGPKERADLAEQIPNWHLHFIELDKGGARSPDSHAVHLGRRNAWSTLDDDERKPSHSLASRPNGRDEVIGVAGLGHPLLSTVNDVVRLVIRERRGGDQVGDVGATFGLSRRAGDDDRGGWRG